MRARSLAGSIAHREATTHVTLDLDLDVGSDPIAGALCDENGAGARFCGWLELASALEQLLRPTAAGAAHP